MPDVTGSRIVVGDLSATGPTISGIASAIGEELATLSGLLAPIRESWIARSAVDWDSLQARWDKAAADLMAAPGALGAIGHVAAVNWTNYVDLEAANVRTWAH
jgi:hypothetical protein